MLQHVPNILTFTRLGLAILFFSMLGYYQFDGRGAPTFLNLASVVYLLALATDFLDGYLARRWKAEGAFGRVFDPLVDKVLVLGSFIFFAGKNFIIPWTADPNSPYIHTESFIARTITGVAPWMVVVMLARELLVTSFRGLSESEGRRFGADWSGKIKMGVQSVTILIILIYVNYLPWLQQGGYERLDAALMTVRDVAIWTTLIVTVLSGLLYIRRALRGTKRPEPVGSVAAA
jgi:CDP-diacylglycerol--glycerol-3-phosphate 3-phosphatidyltransferase